MDVNIFGFGLMAFFDIRVHSCSFVVGFKNLLTTNGH